MYLSYVLLAPLVCVILLLNRPVEMAIRTFLPWKSEYLAEGIPVDRAVQSLRTRSKRIDIISWVACVYFGSITGHFVAELVCDMLA